MIQEFFSKLHHIDQLIIWAGYLGLTAIVFCETGLLAGFFLPGDSLLVTAGFLASQGHFDFWVLSGLLTAAAIIGDSTGYLIGHFAGPRIFNKNDSFFFKREYLEKTHKFFEKYGAKTIVLARFVPIVRTFAPTVAGVGRMSYKKFLAFNVIGGILWVFGMTFIGYFLGRAIPGIDKKIHYVIAAVIIVSFLPLVFEWRRAVQEKRLASK